MYNLNIYGDGAKAVGPIGLKKAEKELIQRRYKNHHHQDSMNRMAIVYGGGVSHSP